MKQMDVRRIQFILSAVFIIGYLIMVGTILVVETSDSLNMEKGANSMMGELKILLGVMTGAVAQILNFWFNQGKGNSQAEVVQPPAAPAPTPAPAPPTVPEEGEDTMRV